MLTEYNGDWSTGVASEMHCAPTPIACLNSHLPGELRVHDAHAYCCTSDAATWFRANPYLRCIWSETTVRQFDRSVAGRNRALANLAAQSRVYLDRARGQYEKPLGALIDRPNNNRLHIAVRKYVDRKAGVIAHRHTTRAVARLGIGVFCWRVTAAGGEENEK